MQTLRLEPSVLIEFREGQAALESPRYYPGGLSVDIGPMMDHAEHERFVLDETVGSVDWDSPAPVDEYRFDRLSRMLARLSLVVSEYSEEGWERPLSWLSVNVVSGTIQLSEPIGDFYVAPAATRWCDARNLILLRSPTGGGGERLRIALAPGFQLLFEGGLLAGWILEEPERRISTVEGGLSLYPADPELAEIMAEYLQLMAFPTLDGLAEGDPDFKHSLEGMVERLRVDAGATDRRESLRRVIEDVMEYWYS